jgi:hypothetical protein
MDKQSIIFFTFEEIETITILNFEAVQDYNFSVRAVSPASVLYELTTDKRLALCSSLVANWRADSPDRRFALSLLQFSAI